MNLLQRLVLAIAALRTVVRTATAQLLCDELSALQTFSFCEELVCTTPWSESIPAQDAAQKYCVNGNPAAPSCGSCIKYTGSGRFEPCCSSSDTIGCFQEWQQADCSSSSGNDGTASGGSSDDGVTSSDDSSDEETGNSDSSDESTNSFTSSGTSDTGSPSTPTSASSAQTNSAWNRGIDGHLIVLVAVMVVLL